MWQNRSETSVREFWFQEFSSCWWFTVTGFPNSFNEKGMGTAEIQYVYWLVSTNLKHDTPLKSFEILLNLKVATIGIHWFPMEMKISAKLESLWNPVHVFHTPSAIVNEKCLFLPHPQLFTSHTIIADCKWRHTLIGFRDIHTLFCHSIRFSPQDEKIKSTFASLNRILVRFYFIFFFFSMMD